MSAEPQSEKLAKKERTPTKAPSAQLQHGIYYHIPALILAIIVFGLLIVSWISSASISLNTPGGRLASTPWLLHINQTMQLTIELDGSAESKTLRRWGFGTFGFCEWNYNTIDMMQPGKCVKNIGWILPASAEEGSDILAITMPVAIGKVLSWMSLILGLSTVAAFFYAIALVIAFFYRPFTINKNKGTDEKPAAVFIKSDDRSAVKRRLLYELIRSWKGRVVLCGVVEINNNDKQKLQAEVGSGGYMLVAVVVIVPIIDILVYFGGLRVR